MTAQDNTGSNKIGAALIRRHMQQCATKTELQICTAVQKNREHFSLGLRAELKFTTAQCTL
jgi:hypothetical protein